MVVDWSDDDDLGLGRDEGSMHCVDPTRVEPVVIGEQDHRSRPRASVDCQRMCFLRGPALLVWTVIAIRSAR